MIVGSLIDSSVTPTLYPAVGTRWNDATPFSSIERASDAFVRYKGDLSSLDSIPGTSSVRNSIDAHWLGYFDIDPKDASLYSRGTSINHELFPGTHLTRGSPSTIRATGFVRYALAARVRLAAADDPDLDSESGANAWYILIFKVGPLHLGNGSTFPGISGAIFDYKGSRTEAQFPNFKGLLFNGSIFAGYSSTDIEDLGDEIFVFLGTREAVVHGVQTHIPFPSVVTLETHSSGNANVYGTTQYSWSFEVVMPLAHELVEPVGPIYTPAPSYEVLDSPPPSELYSGDRFPGDWGWDLAR